MTKGIILASGSGTSLNSLIKVMSNQLIPVYDKPIVYNTLVILIFARIRNI